MHKQHAHSAQKLALGLMSRQGMCENPSLLRPPRTLLQSECNCNRADLNAKGKRTDDVPKIPTQAALSACAPLLQQAHARKGNGSCAPGDRLHPSAGQAAQQGDNDDLQTDSKLAPTKHGPRSG